MIYKKYTNIYVTTIFVFTFLFYNLKLMTRNILGVYFNHIVPDQNKNITLFLYFSFTMLVKTFHFCRK